MKEVKARDKRVARMVGVLFIGPPLGVSSPPHTPPPPLGPNVGQETCPLRLSVPFAVGARVLTLKFLEPDM